MPGAKSNRVKQRQLLRGVTPSKSKPGARKDLFVVPQFQPAELMMMASSSNTAGLLVVRLRHIVLCSCFSLGTYNSSRTIKLQGLIPLFLFRYGGKFLSPTAVLAAVGSRAPLLFVA
jgi:hypothetical protein